MTGPLIDRRAHVLADALDGVPLDQSEQAIVDWMTRACDVGTLRLLGGIIGKARDAGRKPLALRLADRLWGLVYPPEVTP